MNYGQCLNISLLHMIDSSEGTGFISNIEKKEKIFEEAVVSGCK